MIALIIFWRNLDAFVYPVLFGEDGTRLFAYYLNERGLGSILREYAGYTSFGANLMGWIVGLFPVVAQPHLLAANAAIVATGCLWLFSSKRFTPLLAGGRARCVLCVCLALLPVGNFALMTCTMFVGWHLLLAAFLLLFAEAPTPGWRRRAEFAFTWLCLWTNPVSIVLVPIYSWRAWRETEPGSRRHYAMLGLLALIYQAAFVSHTVASGGISVETLSVAGQMLMERVLAEPLVGSSGRGELVSNGVPLAILLPGIAIVLFLAGCYRRTDQRRREFLLGVGWIALVLTGMVVCARFEARGNMVEWGYRYFYVQKLVLYLGVMVAAAGASVRMRPLLAVFLLHAVTLQLLDPQPYETSVEEGKRVMSFVHDVAEWRADPSSQGESMVYDNGRRRIEVRAVR